MKTLLLALVAVAFVHLDSGYTLECYSCGGLFCLLPVQCQEEEKYCIAVHVHGNERIRGCAENCTYTEPNMNFKCCSANLCNKFI